MGEMTVEQKQAIALADAKMRMEDDQRSSVATKVKPPMFSFMPAAPNPGMPLDKLMADFHARSYGSGVGGAAYGAGGKVTDIASGLGASPELAGGIGFAANVGMQAIPTLFGGRFAQQNVAPAIQNTARSLMQSAVKPTLQDLQTGDAAKAINTMLEQGYNPTQGGVQAMQSKIDALGNEIKTAIAQSPAMINKNAVASRLNDALTRFKSQVNPNADLGSIERAWTEFLSHPDLAGKAEMPVQLAQQMKQGTYSALGNKVYGELSGASTEAQKQLARGLKEEISAAVPQVAPMNELQSQLINARDIAMRRALMSSNRNPLSLAPLASGPTGFLGFMADKSDLLKSILARSLYSTSNPLSYGLGAGIGGVMGAQSGMSPEDRAALWMQP